LATVEGVPVALCQFSPRPGDVRGNLATVARQVGRAAREGARLVVLPELCTTGYHMGAMFGELAEPLDGQTAGVLRELSRRWDVHVVVGMAERSAATGGDGGDGGGVLHDSAVLVGPGGVMGAGRKARLWDREAGVFEPGEGAVVPTPLGALGLLVCYDLEHPELVHGLVARGAQLIVAVAAFSDLGLWRATLVARARAAGVPIAAANRTGSEASSRFCGHSMVVGADGAVVAEAAGRAGVTVATVRTAPASRARRPPDRRMVYPEYG
jgi:predicted amidohydrolase